jgi:hypothetical protein
MRAMVLAAMAALGLSGCGVLPGGASDAATSDFVMRWDHRPEAPAWTDASLAMLHEGAPAGHLPDLVPADIETWCPAYPDAPRAEREAFWVGLLSTLARHESTWNPQAVGGGGQWFGLVQISPATARHYGCDATSGGALRDGAANLSCALRIWGATVSRDGVVAEGRGGVAADWGPFVQADKREDMRAWVRAQPFCAG